MSKLLRSTGIALLLVVIVVGPFFRGLFFGYEVMAGVAAVMLGGALWTLGRRLGGLPVGLPGGPAGWALLALTASYLVIFAWAVYYRANLDWFLRAAAAWLAFVMVRGEAGPTMRRWLGWCFLIGALAVAVVGLLEFTGYFKPGEGVGAALAYVGLQSRLFSVYQYPNTAAAVFMAAIVGAIALALDDPKPWKVTLLGALSSLVAVAFFFTLSRGAVLVLPFGLLLLFAGLDRTRLWRAVLLTGAMLAAPILVSMHGIAQHLPKRDWVGAARWELAAVAAGALACLALALLFKLRGRLQVALVAVLVAGAIAGYVFVRPAGPLVPKMAERLFDVNFRTVNVVLRLHYDLDAWKIVQAWPLGHGGAGWERTYRQHQDYGYYATQTHNHYAQTAVEAGVQGLAALLAGLALALWQAFRGRKGDPLRWGLAAAGGLIAGHAAIDFNLSYLTVWLMVWMLLASAGDPPAGTETAPRLSAALVPVSAALTGLALVTAMGAYHSYHAQELADRRERDAAKVRAEAARRFDPWNTQPLLVIKSLESLQLAVRLDRHNDEAWSELATQLELKRDYAGAYEAARRALELRPSRREYYEAYARLAGFRLDAALGSGDLTEARNLGAELLQTFREFDRRRVLVQQYHYLWPAGGKLFLTHVTHLNFGKAHFLAGDYRQAEPYLKAAATQWTFATEAEVWLHALYEREGRKAEQQPLEKKPWVRFRHVNPTYQAILKWQ